MRHSGMARRALLGGGVAAMALRPARAGAKFDLIVGAREGTASDRDARAFVPFLERHLPHVRVNVLNHPGHGGLAAFRALADAPPDGPTLGWVATPSLPARTVDSPGAETLLAQLRLIGAVAKEPIALVSAAESPLASAQDIIHRSSENADAVPLGTPPAGSPPHLAALRLQAIAGTKLNIVAFPSAAAARQAALAGNVAAAMLALGDAIDALRDGTLTGLGIAARDRAEAFPQMPPLRESGLHLSAFIRRGLAAPLAMPDPVAATLAAALREVTADAEFQAEAESDGFIAAWLDGSGWSAQAQAERADLARLWHNEPWLPSGTS